MRKAAHLHHGFSRQGNALHSSMRNFYEARADGSIDRSLNRAIAELRALAKIHNPSLDQIAASTWPAGTIADFDISSVVDVLHSTLQEASNAVLLEEQLKQVNDLAHVRKDFDFRDFFDAPLPLLCAAILRVSLYDYVIGNIDLFNSPLGSVSFFMRAAALDSQGLGPYFSNVGHLVKRSKDLFEMGRIAASASQKDDEGTGSALAWSVVLSRGTSSGLFREFIDDLGDSSESLALEHILKRLCARARHAVDFDLVALIRDAALDNADYSLAAKAQAAIVGLRPDSSQEQMILGSIQASGRDFRLAELTFSHGLLLDPGNEEAQAKLHAVKARNFTHFAVSKGFGSPADRQHTRLSRRSSNVT
jgi:hypothetical protein